MDEKDVRGFIKQDEFEQLAPPMLERVKGPCEQVLIEAGVNVDKIHAVEVVGSGSRIPAISKILTETFGKKPRRTMNTSEWVARECALQCAILSLTFKVCEFKVQESFPFSIVLVWKGSASASEDGSSEQQQMTNCVPQRQHTAKYKGFNIL
jgi:heat shock protein 4